MSSPWTSSPASIICRAVDAAAPPARRAGRSGRARNSRGRTGAASAGSMPPIGEIAARLGARPGRAGVASKISAASASTSCRLARCWSRASPSRLARRHRQRPPSPRAVSTASGKLRPFGLHQEGEDVAVLAGGEVVVEALLVVDEERRRLLRVERRQARAIRALPCCSLTRAPTTCDTGTRARISSRKSVENFIPILRSARRARLGKAGQRILPGFHRRALPRSARRSAPISLRAAAAVIGSPKAKPWANSHPSCDSSTASDSVSAPSVITSMPRSCAIATTERRIAGRPPGAVRPDQRRIDLQRVEAIALEVARAKCSRRRNRRARGRRRVRARGAAAAAAYSGFSITSALGEFELQRAAQHVVAVERGAHVAEQVVGRASGATRR